jgi:hypothetical protein
MSVALPVVISGGIEWPLGSLPTIGPGSAGMEVPGMVSVLPTELAGLCAEALSVDPKSDAATIERQNLDRMRNLLGRGASESNFDPSSMFRPVRMIKLTKQRQIDPYPWVHPDDEWRGRRFTPAGFFAPVNGCAASPCERSRMPRTGPCGTPWICCG